MASINKVTILGNVGNDPEVKTMQSGDRVANFTLATSESWKDKATGEKKERTEWHRVVCFNQPLVNVIENYVRKGSKLYIEGQIETRSYDKDGQKVYTTEVVLRPYRGEIVILDSRSNDGGGFTQQVPTKQSMAAVHGGVDELEDEIPF